MVLAGRGSPWETCIFLGLQGGASLLPCDQVSLLAGGALLERGSPGLALVVPP